MYTSQRAGAKIASRNKATATNRMVISLGKTNKLMANFQGEGRARRCRCGAGAAARRSASSTRTGSSGWWPLLWLLAVVGSYRNFVSMVILLRPLVMVWGKHLPLHISIYIFCGAELLRVTAWRPAHSCTARI
jgi:hypothetical protein